MIQQMFTIWSLAPLPFLKPAWTSGCSWFTYCWSLARRILSIILPGGSEGKASPCNVGDLGLIPGSGRSPGEGNGNPLQCSCLENPRDRGAWWASVYGVTQSRTWLMWLSSSSFPGSSDGKASAYNEGDLGLIPGSGRSLGEGNGNSPQYSCLENPTDQGAWWATVHEVTKSWTRLSDFTSLRFSK